MGIIVGPPSSEKAYLEERYIKYMVLCTHSNTCKSYNYVASKSSSPSIMHDRAVIIWTVQIVCHLFPEVVHLVCQNIKDNVGEVKKRLSECSII